MAIRAVIIANESYPAMKGGGLAQDLEGTVDDATRFRKWLIEKKGVAEANIVLRTNATQREISIAFRDLVTAGQDDTEELYVFYSGHGFSWSDSMLRARPADILVGSDFENQQDSGNACLKLSEVTTALDLYMGPGTHYYFIDACRNDVSATAAEPGGLGWRRNLSRLGKPTAFTMFSTERGSFALVRSGFAPKMIEGLVGKGRAKRRERTEWWVTFDSLRAYLQDSLSQNIQVEPGNGPGRIFKIDPAPVSRCTIAVKKADPADVFTVVLMNANGQQVGAPMKFKGPTFEIKQPPDDYFLQVSHSGFQVKPADPAAIDLFDDCTLDFEKTSDPIVELESMPAPMPPPPPAAVPLKVKAPPSTFLEMTNLQTGESVRAPAAAPAAAPGEVSFQVPPGSYGLKVRELGWTAVRYLRFLVDPAFSGLESTLGGATIGATGGTLEVGDRDPHPVRDGLLSMIPGAHNSSTVNLSEQLGPMANQDLGLWLSLIGATRILGPAQFEKLGGLPLMSFDDVKPGTSPVYVLAGFAKVEGQLSVAVESIPSVTPPWTPMQSAAGVPGLFEFRADGPPGSKLVRFRIGDRAPMSTLTYTLAGRATLFVVASDAEGGMRIHQFILPLSNRNFALRAIRFITLAQRQVARRRSAMPPEDAAAEDIQRWNELLSGDWLDPVMGLLAAYELANNSRLPDAEKLPALIQNLRTAYPDLPDVELVAKLANLPYTEPTGTPLFLTGYHALDKQKLPLPAGKLDYNGPWLTWLGV